jgi:hypothetical protein
MMPSWITKKSCCFLRIFILLSLCRLCGCIMTDVDETPVWIKNWQVMKVDYLLSLEIPPAWKGGEGKGKLISAYPVNCCGSVVR